jgi:hypothetical protein
MKNKGLRGVELTKYWLSAAKQMQQNGRTEVCRGSFTPHGIPVRVAEYRMDQMYKLRSELGSFPTAPGYRISYKLQDLVKALENHLELADKNNPR